METGAAFVSPGLGGSAPVRHVEHVSRAASALDDLAFAGRLDCFQSRLPSPHWNCSRETTYGAATAINKSASRPGSCMKKAAAELSVSIKL
jgi:hypothetical protein